MRSDDISAFSSLVPPFSYNTLKIMTNEKEYFFTVFEVWGSHGSDDFHCGSLSTQKT
jgi:hypothetical protein